ncbi:CoA-transferase [Hyphomonas sp.]|uniref:CoA-transferase n=1 Tax=Hyphomonas sp. TaxID=87 RepID=UPI003D2DB61D
MRNATIDCTRKELIATFISKQMKDDDAVSFPAGIPEVRVGVFLANLTHAPDLRIQTTMSQINVHREQKLEDCESAMDWRFYRFAEGFYLHHECFDFAAKHSTAFFVGGIQIDRFGNTNLIGLGKDPKKLDFRGPGSLGSTTMATQAGRYYIYTNAHNKRVFVEECDFISAYGWGKGGADARSKLGLPGGGPKYVISPLGVMDFEEETKALRLKYLHPGVTAEEVQDNTGFDLIIPDRIEQTPAPSQADIDIIRERVDINGMLRG